MAPKLSDFDFVLDKQLIAQQPLKKRDESKLLVYNAINSGSIEHKQFKNLIDYLKKGDVLVVNESKVKRTKLYGKKITGSAVEVILEENLGNNRYRTKIKGKPKKDMILIFGDLRAKIYDSTWEDYFIEFETNPLEYIEKNAFLPFPAYIKDASKINEEQYQTVYSKKEGSLAAPTAGLHFTPELLNKIKEKGVKLAKVCLHVDFGTFMPIVEEDFTKHKIHTEEIEINKENADIINNRIGRLIVVGTTTMRTLESMNENGKIVSGKKTTSIFIYPGYVFKNKVDALITNFHLPKSTLLLMVSTFIGREKILELYEIAKKNNYRFYSFGDAMILFK